MESTKAALHRLAAEVRGELGLAVAEPFDPFAWAELYGVPFLSLTQTGASPQAIRRFTVEVPELWSAALIERPLGYAVVYNPAHALTRIRSNLAHEVAHFIAEHELSPSWLTEANGCGSASAEQETEAAELAGALLIPVVQARWHAMRGHSADEVAERYEVSVPMARWRLSVSGGQRIAQRARARR